MSDAPQSPPSFPAGEGRVAVIGDVGGHLHPLREELARLGAQLRRDPLDVRLPADLTVLQVGDLVHRGPDSAGVVALVARLIDGGPGRWVQLVGNHEAQYLRPPAFHWPEHIGEVAELTLRDLWRQGRIHAAAAVDVPDGQWLVTHAGVTAGYWRRALDAPRSAVDAARALDAMRFVHDEVLFHAGTVLGGGPPDPLAGPIWASAGEELVPGWLTEQAPPPFAQAHGHSAMTDWRRGRLAAAPDVAAVTRIDTARAHETTTVRGVPIVGIDPRHGRTPHRPWQALELGPARVSWPPA